MSATSSSAKLTLWTTEVIVLITKTPIAVIIRAQRWRIHCHHTHFRWSLLNFMNSNWLSPFRRNYLSLPPCSLSLFLPPLLTIFRFQTTCAQGALSELLRQTNVVFVVVRVSGYLVRGIREQSLSYAVPCSLQRLLIKQQHKRGHCRSAGPGLFLFWQHEADQSFKRWPQPDKCSEQHCSPGGHIIPVLLLHDIRNRINVK